MHQGIRQLGRAALALALVAPLAAAQAELVRGPYLQSRASGTVTVVWDTATASTGGLRVGKVPGGPWELTLAGGSATTHVFDVTGLTPDTKYYYEALSNGAVVAGGPHYHFFTPRSQNSTKPFRFVAWGDSGTGNGTQFDVASLLDNLRPQPDLALGLGDLVYEFGAWAEYDPAFFTPYSGFQRNRMLWVSIGNHDIQTSNGAPYLANFHLPTNTGAPTNLSGTELYYSFDVGMAHFVCLDLWVSDTSVGGAQYNWMLADLENAQARGKRWIIVFNHSPPYTKGTHDSTTEGDLIAFRQDWLPPMEARGMDMLFAGHSHNYERSYLVQNDTIVQGGASDYSKISNPTGAIYVVNGSGKPQTGPLDHPLMAQAMGVISGLVILDVSYDEIRGHFLEEDGSLLDEFVLRKGADTTPPHPRESWVPGPSVEKVRVAFNEPVRSGGGAGGAENAANYSLGGGASVFAATLLADDRTVELSTSALTKGSAYVLTINGVQEAAPGSAAVTPNSRTVFLVPRDGSGVERGATWRYFEGSSAPPATWMNPGFNDSGWSTGPAGFGFGYGGGAVTTTLGSMSGNASSLFLRKTFTVNDASAVTAMTLEMDYADGFIVYLNGQEIERSNAPATPAHNGLATLSHAGAIFRVFDVTRHRAKLVDGTNTLAVVGYNTTLFGSDFLLHPRLALEGDPQAGNQPPVAVYEANKTAGNAPLTVDFSSASSSDPDGSIGSVLWVFGDGSPASSGASPSHTFTAPGLYTVSLLVTDDGGEQALSQGSIFVSATGTDPIVSLTASSTTVTAGGTIAFDASGSSDPDGGAVTFAWDFDDPGSGSENVSSLASPSHVFSTAGTYDVTVTVTDDEGASAQGSITINAATGGAPPPAADDSGGGGGGCYFAPPDDPERTAAPLALAWILLGAWVIWHARRGKEVRFRRASR